MLKVSSALRNGKIRLRTCHGFSVEIPNSFWNVGFRIFLDGIGPMAHPRMG